MSGWLYMLMIMIDVGVSERGRRHLCSSSYRTLAVPRTRTTVGDRSFAVTGPCMWNSLPATIKTDHQLRTV